MHVQKNISLKKLNTFGVDVNASYYTEICTFSDIQELSRSNILNSEPHIILGGGSNILFTQDFEGLVIKNNIKGISLVGEDEHHYYVKISGGEDWHQVVLKSLKQKWYGLENLSLIPGCAGAAPIQNIGAYGVELKDVFYQLMFYYLDGEQVSFDKEGCQFEYRNSIFKHQLKGKGIIAEVTLKLNKSPEVNISYGALKNYFNGMEPEEITPEMVHDAVIDIRTSKLPHPDKLGNAGSFFKNPVVNHHQLQNLLSDFTEMPYFSINEAMHKIPAAWLIDQCGWKGKRRKEAGVHNKQALVLVNYGKATGKEVIELARDIQQSVRERFNIDLEPEVNVI